jgi:hypothetical protein
MFARQAARFIQLHYTSWEWQKAPDAVEKVGLEVGARL